MSNTIYNTRKYVRFSFGELVSIAVTSVSAGFILSCRDLLFERFKESASVREAVLLILFLFAIFLVCVWLCKLVAIRLGHVIRYQPHFVGLAIGMGLAIMSAGYLPLFLPGGFSYAQPERLLIGKWRGYHKSWEVGLIAGTFPLALLLFILILSPLYLTSGSAFYLNVLLSCALAAAFSCIPAPMLQGTPEGRIRDWYRYMRGSTFGLDVLFSSKAWYTVLCVTVLFFGFVGMLYSSVGVRVGVFLFVLSFLVGLAALWVYAKFFPKESLI